MGALDQLGAHQLLGVAPSSVVIGQVRPPWIKHPCDPARRLKWYSGMTVGEPSDDAEGSYCSGYRVKDLR